MPRAKKEEEKQKTNFFGRWLEAPSPENGLAAAAAVDLFKTEPILLPLSTHTQSTKKRSFFRAEADTDYSSVCPPFAPPNQPDASMLFTLHNQIYLGKNRLG